MLRIAKFKLAEVNRNIKQGQINLVNAEKDPELYTKVSVTDAPSRAAKSNANTEPGANRSQERDKAPGANEQPDV